MLTEISKVVLNIFSISIDDFSEIYEEIKILTDKPEFAVYM